MNYFSLQCFLPMVNIFEIPILTIHCVKYYLQVCVIGSSLHIALALRFYSLLFVLFLFLFRLSCQLMKV